MLYFADPDGHDVELCAPLSRNRGALSALDAPLAIASAGAESFHSPASVLGQFASRYFVARSFRCSA
jgi:hypothetical protein